MKCAICGNDTDNRVFDVREMMFGIREVFRYFQCSACWCLQIEEIPRNLADYYPSGYYSFNDDAAKKSVKRFFLRHRDRYAIWGKGLLGRILYSRHRSTAHRSLYPLKIDKNTRILDVGCGAGQLLCSLRDLGCVNLLGVDLFNPTDIEYGNGVLVRKTQIENVEGKWDVVMFHHAFEHIADPLGTLRRVERLLDADGCCIIRIPTVSSYAWEHYGTDWVQLDAPRHLFLHSLQSMEYLSAKAGMRVTDVVFDSSAFQFWGSERYARDIPLHDRSSVPTTSNAMLFTRRELAGFAKHAKELNETQQGDQAIFYLSKQ